MCKFLETGAVSGNKSQIISYSDKEEYFLELCRMEDTKILNALNALHSRLTEGKKQMALKWSVEYNVLLGERRHVLTHRNTL